MIGIFEFIKPYKTNQFIGNILEIDLDSPNKHSFRSGARNKAPQVISILNSWRDHVLLWPLDVHYREIYGCFFLPENPDESQQMRNCCRTASGLLKSSCGFNPSENKIVNVEYGENDQTSEGCFTRKGGSNLGCKKSAHQIGHALDLKRSGNLGIQWFSSPKHKLSWIRYFFMPKKTSYHALSCHK